MKLVIVSHTPHYRRGGTILGWGATVREIDHLASLFTKVVHIAPLHEGSSESALAYESARVQFVPVAPSGGERMFQKLSILGQLPSYTRTILEELSDADVVHVRCPANISLIATLLLSIIRKPRVRWIKYAGSWSAQTGEAWSYKFQRWLLNNRWHRSFVTVNGKWPNQPEHIKSFFNPCLTRDELLEANRHAEGRQLETPLRLIHVGRLETSKGTDRVLRVVASLKQAGLNVRLDLIGDGPERNEFEHMAGVLDVTELTTFHGWVPRSQLGRFYEHAHFMIHLSSSEGWPKVISEAMAYGVVPIASRVGSVHQYLDSFGTGKTFEPDDLEASASAVADYVRLPGKWRQESTNAARAARLFTYEHYLDDVRTLLPRLADNRFEPVASRA